MLQKGNNVRRRARVRLPVPRPTWSVQSRRCAQGVIALGEKEC